MSRVQEITNQLHSMSVTELRELRAELDSILDEYEGRVWDERFGAEVASGQWDALAEKALKDHNEGKSSPL